MMKKHLTEAECPDINLLLGMASFLIGVGLGVVVTLGVLRQNAFQFFPRQSLEQQEFTKGG